MSNILNLYLEREPSNSVCTIGSIYADGIVPRICYSLEDVVREVAGKPVVDWKVPDVTAIPAGRYRILFTYSNHFGRVMLQLMDVPGFSGIRIHSGNTDADTEGCIICGSSIGMDGESVVGSKVARDKLEAFIEAAINVGKEVWITVGWNTPLVTV